MAPLRRESLALNLILFINSYFNCVFMSVFVINLISLSLCTLEESNKSNDVLC